MSDLVTELRVLEKDQNIFDTDMEYIIPLYQRAFAWKDKHLIQLIEDIDDVANDSKYYIGSLIVSKQEGKYEVVDGQQRLTSLFLLLNCLGMDVKNTLSFACRDKSNYTLVNIRELLEENRSKLDMEEVDDGLWTGIKVINEEIKKIDRDKFIDKLSRVVLYRIEVPERTDLNRYFEIMNTRGEQLEQHDILKAKLMSYLEDDEDKKMFAMIWDACSDMTGYVQMHFISKDNRVREEIFGWNWSYLPSDEWDDYIGIIDTKKDTNEGYKITDIIEPSFNVRDDEGYLEDDVRVRFESIIDFSYFLIHTLKVFVELYEIRHENPNKKIVDDLIDDKKLMDNFERVISRGEGDDWLVSENKEYFAQKFIMCLLRTRYLFDKYIIKREYANDNADGKWSLKSLDTSGQKSKKRPYYKNTWVVSSGMWGTTNTGYNRKNTMMQAALRVSYTSPKVMHWITNLLIWLSEDNCDNTGDNIIDYISVAEGIAQEAVIENFFDECPDGVYAMGADTPHIVFNYLDYLLWESDFDYSRPRKYDDFEFEFRNSVEHWYPRHPSEGTFEEWTDGVDQFGNLCIIQRNVNSKFSNMSPEAKKSTFRAMIAKGSLKLRIMSELTEKEGKKAASACWKDGVYKKHEDEMIAILEDACGIEFEE